MISCDQYGPTLQGCTCPEGYIFSTLCGYGRCLQTENGCSAGELFNASCTVAPASNCLTQCRGHQYYSATAQACIPTTVCETAFPDHEVGYLQAYEVRNFTATTDRLCSVCSICPAGYDTVPCTALSDTSCTKDHRLGAGDIAAIFLAVLFLSGAAGVGALYGHRQSHKREVTLSQLELTARLLGDVEVGYVYSSVWFVGSPTQS